MEAVIICAGYGKRMDELTKDSQKCMLRFCGRPLVEFMLENFMSAGVDAVHLVVGYKGDQVKEHFRYPQCGDIREAIHFIEQRPPYDSTAAALLSAEGHAGKEFLYSHGDIILRPEDVKHLYDTKLGGASANVMLSTNPFTPETHMRATVKDGYVEEFYEADVRQPDLMTYVGCDKLTREIFDFLPEDKCVSSALEAMARHGKRIAFTPLSTDWVHVVYKEDLDGQLPAVMPW